MRVDVREVVYLSVIVKVVFDDGADGADDVHRRYWKGIDRL